MKINRKLLKKLIIFSLIKKALFIALIFSGLSSYFRPAFVDKLLTKMFPVHIYTPILSQTYTNKEEEQTYYVYNLDYKSVRLALSHIPEIDPISRV